MLMYNRTNPFELYIFFVEMQTKQSL